MSKAKSSSAKANAANVAIVVPKRLMVAMRVSCTYQALDDNPSNTFNEYADPVQVKVVDNNGVELEACLATPALLKQWCSWMCRMDATSGVVATVKDQTKSKGGSGKLLSSEKRVRCVNVPSAADIERAWPNNPDAQRDWRFVADVLNSTLIMPKDSVVRLYQPKDIKGTTPVFSDQVTSPGTLCKTERLQKIGYGRYAVVGPMRKRFDNFTLAESRRISHAVKQLRGDAVSAEVLSNLTEAQVKAHNVATVQRLNDCGHGTSDERMEALASKRLATLVDPAGYLLLEYDESSKRNKVSSTTKATKDAYAAMIKDLHKCTGHRLSLEDEKKLKTLDYRLSTLAWMRELKAKDPTTRFTWSEAEGDFVIRPPAKLDAKQRSPSPPDDDRVYRAPTVPSRVPTMDNGHRGQQEMVSYAKKPVLTKQADQHVDSDDDDGGAYEPEVEDNVSSGPASDSDDGGMYL